MTVSVAMLAESQESIEIIGDADTFDGLADEWAELGPQRFGPLVSHDWWSCAARAFGLKLHVVVVRRAGRLAAVAPLHRVRGRGIERLELIGSRELFEPSLLPSVDADALERLCLAVAAQGMPVGLQRIESGDPCVAMLAQRGAVRVNPGPSTHVVPRGTEWSGFSGSLKNYRYRRRKLEAMGAVTSEVFAPAESEYTALFDELVAVECRGWKGRNGSALAQNAALGNFMRSFAARMALRGGLRISRLSVGDTPAALQMCVEQDGKYWAIKMGFDEKFAIGSPGFIGHVDLMRHAIEARGCGFECLGLAEDWQRQWRMQDRRYDSVYFYPRTVGGLAARLIDTLMSMAGALRRKGA
jgi:CelD/BcsL family acetyltransferase involved in cellulose biosynthesis